MSLFTMFIDNRCVGRKQGNGEKRTNGMYYIANGDKNALFVGRFVDVDGEFRRVEFYNSQNSKPGKGLADLACKWLSKGKTISFQARAVNRKVDYRNPDDNFNKVIHNGEVLQVEETVYRCVPGTLILGAGRESANQINDEIKNFDSANPSVDPFFRRPEFWNVEGHAHQEIWKGIMAARKGASYIPGNEYYGHALVWLGKKGSENAQTDETKVAGAVDTAAVVDQVGGVTLKALMDNGWTQANILASPEYNVLLPKKAPAPPAPPTTPAPPAEESASSDNEPMYG